MQLSQLHRTHVRIPGKLRGDAGFALAATLGSLLLGVVTLELWKASFSAPWSYTNDALHNLMIVKATITNGWYLHNSALGYPFGQDLYDFPVVEADMVHLLLIKLIGVFNSNPAFVANVFFLITFPLTGLIAYVVLRRLRVSLPVACTCAVLFAVAPYHFFRGELHLFLSGYFAVPVGIWLALAVLTDEPLLERRLSRTTLLTLGACLFVGMSEAYYAAFTILLVAAAALLMALRGRRAAGLAGLVACVAIAGVLAIEHIPAFIYHAQHGTNIEVQKLRSPYDSEVFGLRPTRVLLPVPGHRVHALASLTKRYEENTKDQLGESGQAVGFAALIGLVWMIWVALSAALGYRRDRSPPDDERVVAGGVLALIAVVIATSSGISMLISVFVTDSVRSWARMAIVLTFLGLLGTAILLDRLLVRLRTRRRWRPAFGALLLLAIVALGTLDQMPPELVPDYKGLTRLWENDTDFFRGVEARLPANSPVYQLPVSRVPEYGWDQARGYLHSDSLRWSWGAMQGRDADWQTPLVGKPPTLTMAAAAVTGFKGLVLNLSQYPEPQRVVRDFEHILGIDSVDMRDGRFVFLDMRPYTARLRAQRSAADLAALRDSVLHPVRLVFGADWSAVIVSPGVPESLTRSRAMHKPSSVFTIRNPGRAPRQVMFSGRLATDQPANATVRWPGGATQRFAVPRSGVPLDRTLTVPPGTSEIALSTDASPANDPISARPAYLELVDYTLTDSVQQSFIPPLSSAG